MIDRILIGFLLMFAVMAILVFALLVCEGVYTILYSFVPPFRRRMDRFFESLPKWDDEQ